MTIYKILYFMLLCAAADAKTPPFCFAKRRI